MTLEQFKEKYVGKAVHCDTEKKAKELLKLARDFGWDWRGGESLIEESYWRFHQEDTCYVFYFDKTTGWSLCEYYKSEDYEIVEFESEEKKVKNTKKVFDLGLFVDNKKQRGASLDEIINSIEVWVLECHGLTKEEMNKKNKIVLDKWLKEVEVDVQLTAHEIEVLKALKVLGFNWIARDGNNYLFAYEEKPTRSIEFFYEDGINMMLDKDLFTFITWQDEEPTSIEELLCGLQ